MTARSDVPRIATGVRNLDELLHGGLPQGSCVIIAGTPGAGKTILAQQICFRNAASERRVLYFNTLSESTAKTLRFVSRFRFFEQGKIDNGIQFVDLGVIGRGDGMPLASSLIDESIRNVRPDIVVIDSFKAFQDLAHGRKELRKFSYELAIQLMAWEATCLLLGEFSDEDMESNPLFSIADGLIVLAQREQSGEQQRFLQVVKMRGTDHSRDSHAFTITSSGIEVYAPRVMIQRQAGDARPVERLKTGIAKLDDLLGEGIPRGSSSLLGGVAGTGKTVMLLELLYRGAQVGEKGIIFSFEETEDRLRAAARGLGLDLDREIERGMVKIVFIPQPNISVEQHLLMIQQEVNAFGAMRVCIDSVSVFLHKVDSPKIAREKIFQLASIVQNVQAVGFFATDIPYGSNQISRFGVEETVVDGVILLSSTEEGLERERYVEIYKLRNTAHLKGRHSMSIGRGGITVYPRYANGNEAARPAAIGPSKRLPSGTPGFDRLVGGGLLAGSVTLISGSAGVGKSAFAAQFLLEGCRRNEPSLYVALEESPAQLFESAAALGLPLEAAVKDGLAEILHLPWERVRPNQLLSLVTERMMEQRTQRVVLDSVNQLGDGTTQARRRQLLQILVKSFKSLGATALLTLESSQMYSTERVTGRRFSSIADNLIALRYTRSPGELQPTLTVVKSRGSVHDYGSYRITMGSGGMRIGERIDRPAADQRA